MAQNYTQTKYMQTACTQAVVARRNADAILTIAPFAAVISVSPAPLSDVEKLECSPRGPAPQRLVVHAHELEGAAAITTTEQRAGILREALDAPATADRSAGHRACANAIFVSL